MYGNLVTPYRKLPLPLKWSAGINHQAHLRLSSIGLVQLKALSTIHFINTTTCILEGGNYFFLYTVLYTVLYILVYTVLYIVLHIVLYTVLHIVRRTIMYTAVYTILYTVLSIVLSSVPYTVSPTLFVFAIESQNRLYYYIRTKTY